MINLLKSCIKCNHQQWSDDKKMICDITKNPVHFEDSCNLFEENKELQLKYENEVKSKIHYKNASIGKRITNYCIDILSIGLIEFVIAVILLIFYSIDSELYSLVFINDIGRILFVILLNIIYYTLFESISGKSLGKYITRTKVINLNGEKTVWTIILLRSVCRLIPFDQLSFLVSNEKGWHDKLSKTIVIEEQT